MERIVADHLLGGELVCNSINNQNGLYEIKLTLDRHCGSSSLPASLLIDVLEYDESDKKYIHKRYPIDTSGTEYIVVPCSDGSAPCVASNKLVQRNFYKTEIILKSSAKHTIVFFKANYRPEVSNITSTTEPLLLYNKFLPNHNNVNCSTKEEFSHYPIIYQTVENNLNFSDTENDSILLSTSAPFKDLVYKLNENLDEIFIKSNLKASLNDSKPFYMSESSISIQNQTLRYSPNSTQTSLYSILAKEYRMVGSSYVLISERNIERHLKAVNIWSQFSIDSIYSANSQVVASDSSIGICHNGSVSAINMNLLIEKNIDINSQKFIFKGQDITSLVASNRALGSVVDTLILGLNIDVSDIDYTEDLIMRFILCDNNIPNGFSKEISVPIQYHHYKVFKSDSILSCSTPLNISTYNIDYSSSLGTIIDNNGEKYIQIMNPQDTWLKATLSTPSSICPSEDSLYITHGSDFTISNVVTTPSCYSYSDGAISTTITGTNGPYIYKWDMGATTKDIVNVSSGKYSLTVTDNDKCSQVEEVIVPQNDSIEASWVMDDEISCYGQANGKGHIEVSSTIKPYEYNWNHTTLKDSSLSNLSGGVLSGTYLYINSSSNSCIQDFSIEIKEPDSIELDYIKNNLTCHGENDGKIAILAFGGNAPYKYYFNNQEHPSNLKGNLSAGLYYCHIIDNKNCISNSITIDVETPTEIEYETDITDAYCSASSSGIVKIENLRGGHSPYMISFDGGGYGIDTLFFNLTKGTYVVNVKDKFECVKQKTVEVKSIYELSANIISTKDISCYGLSDGEVRIRVNSGQAPFTFSNNGSTISSSERVITLKNFKAGNNNIHIEDDNHCFLDIEVNINEPSKLTIEGKVRDITCEGEKDGSVLYKINGGIEPYNLISFKNANGVDVTCPFSMERGNYQLIIQDNNGCEAKEDFEIKGAEKFEVEIVESNSISCFGKSDGGLSLKIEGGESPYTYKWSNGSNSEEIDGIGTGKYTITLTDNNKCVANASFVIPQPMGLRFDEIKISHPSCYYSNNGSISVSASGGSQSGFSYSIDGTKFTSLNQIPNLKVGNYTLIARDDQNCTTATSVHIKEKHFLKISTPQNLNILLGDSKKLIPQIAFGDNTDESNINYYKWTTDIGLSCTDCLSPTASPYSTTDYKLEINYGENCSETMIFPIAVSEKNEVFIPNSFTPNGDDHNDKWRVYGTHISELDVEVYDRSGIVLYRSKNKNEGWNGTYKNKIQNPGVYSYQVSVKYLSGQEETYSGFLTLFR